VGLPEGGDRHAQSRETTAPSRLYRAASRSRRRRSPGRDGGADLATKDDITGVKAEIAELRSELRQSELRLEAKIEAIKADILNRVFGLILGTLVVNIVAIVGAMFAVAKVVAH
jgi:hypothetical protein